MKYKYYMELSGSKLREELTESEYKEIQEELKVSGAVYASEFFLERIPINN